MRTSRRYRYAILGLTVALAAGMTWAGEPTSTLPVTLATEAQAPTAEPPQDVCELDVQEGTEVPEITNPSLPTLDLGLEMDAVCSPPPECFQDRDCNRICGKNNGTCHRVNSCYRECICNAA